MMELAAYRADLAPRQDLQPSLFTDFVTWIDRSPRTTQTYLNNLKQFAAWMKYAGITRPQREDIISYRQYLGQDHAAITLDNDNPNGWAYRTDANGEPVKVSCKPSTVAQYMRSVSQFFRWTAANGLYPDIAANVHAPKISRDHHRKDYLTPADVQAVERSIEDKAQAREEAAQTARKDRAGRVERSTQQAKRLYAMYELAVTAGLRTVELSRANIKDFETKAGQAYLYIWGKGHTEADTRKPLAPEVAAAISDYLATRTDKKTGSAPLFVSTGNRSGGKRIAPCTIGKMLKKALKEAGYNSDKLTAHSLRHSAAMGVLGITNNNIFESQKYLRHENPATTEIYLHETAQQDQQQADIAQRLYNLFHGKEAGSDSKLKNLMQKMTPAQIKSLTEIAAALAK